MIHNAVFACKIVFGSVSAVKLFRNKTKTILRANAANFLQICVNLQKYWKNVMSNDGMIIEYMDLSPSFSCKTLHFVTNIHIKMSNAY
jgi:hypothetical protein